MSLSLSSLLQQWSSGPSGSAARPPSASEWGPTLVVFLIPGFLVSWLLFLVVDDFYLHLLSFSANLLAPLLSHGFEYSKAGEMVVFRFRGASGFEAEVEAAALYANTVFLWALIVATPRINLLYRARLFLVATLVLLATQVLFLFVKVEVALLGAGHPLASLPALWHFLDDFFEITGKGFFAVAIWLGCVLPVVLGRVASKKAPRAAVARNAPCPCGSGKKYKRCCGLT